MKPQFLLPTVLSGGRSYIQRMLGLSPIAFWAMIEESGTAGVCSVDSNQNGTYARDVSAMGTTTGPDGKPAPVFDGTNDVLDVYTTAFRDAFDLAAAANGSISLMAEVTSAGIWTDDTAQSYFRFRDDTNNFVHLLEDTTDNQVAYFYKAGGTEESETVSGQSDTDFVNWILTWDRTEDEFKVYKNNVQVGTTQTGLGIWVGPIISTMAAIGANSTVPGNPWNGSVCRFAVFDKVLSSAERAICTNP